MEMKQKEREHLVMKRESIEENSKVEKFMELVYMKARMVYSSEVDSRTVNKLRENSSGVLKINTLTKVAWSRTNFMARVFCAKRMELTKVTFRTASEWASLLTSGKMATDTKACFRTIRRVDMENYTTLKDNLSIKEHGKMTKLPARE